MSEQPTIVVTYPGFDPEDERTAGALRAAGLSIRCEPRLGERTPQQVIGFMADAAGGIVSTDPFDASVFAACPRLRVLARVGVGFDAIDLDAATAAGVAVATTPGVNAATVADHAVALLLACCRRLLENDRMVRGGGWERGGDLNGRDLTGATVAIVGLGAIGRAVAQRLRGFDVELLGVDLSDVDANGLRRCTLPEALARADVLSVHVPLSPATRGLVGARELSELRPGAILINTSRGGVVEEDALIAALQDGRVAAAGLDVFEREPPAGSPLLDMENVVLSPHIAGISIDVQQTMLEMAVAAVLDVLAGRTPAGVVNPQALMASGEPA